MAAAPVLVSAAFIVLVIALCLFLLVMAKSAEVAAGAAPATVRRTAALMIVWLGLTGILAASGFFADFAGRPPRLLFAVAPAMVAVVLIAGIGRLHTVPASWLVGGQSFRVVMELILWRLAAAQALPEIMTFHGRNFDGLTGLTAPLVAWGIARGRVGAWGVVLWNLAGLALVTNVFLIGLASTPTVFRRIVTEPPNTVVAGFPFVWLVVFVVPVAYLLHLLSLGKTLTSRSDR